MRRTGVTVLAVAAIAAAAAFLLVGSAGAANFGVAVLKDCTTPINVGDPYSCEVELDNLSQASHASVRVTSLTDVVQAAGGAQTQVYPINSSSFSLQGGLILTGGATCDATGCTVPFGGTLTTPFFSHYAAQVGDFPQLNDQATYTWNEICATSILPGCSSATNNSQATASAEINPVPTTTTTSINSGGVGGVSAVAAGSSVSDSVTVANTIQNQPPPTGSVTVNFYSTIDCSGNPVDAASTDPLDGNGQALNVHPEGPLAAGLYSYQAVYPGSPDGAYTGSTGACEPLRVVDANIQITPPTATNRVGTNHTLTCHINTNDGSGYLPAPDGTVCTVNITSGPGTPASQNCTTSGGTGDCQVTITSSTTGTSTIQASTSVSVAGVTLNRQTGDGLPGDSPNASKLWVNAAITIAPNATNAVGQPHTFTATVLADTGSGFQPVGAGVDCNITLTPANGANPVPAGPLNTTTNAAGQCSITFTSQTAGTVTGHASSTLSVAGSAPFTVQTDGTGANSGDATKTFVDANIQITPANATNPIGTNHVLTITVNAIGGTLDAGPHTATASIVSGPGSFVGSPSCTYTGGGASASCTVTITSNVAGTTVIQATSDIPVNGVSITRTTGTAQNTASGGSDNAQKLWVQPDANIQLTPGTATNAVGTNHTLHCHVNVSSDGTTFTNAPDGTVCTVTITSGPGTPTSQNCTTSGGTGTCDVTITSATAGTTTLSASTTVTVNTVVLTRTTDGTAGNSGPATKVWVDANIQISPPTATNAVGTNHVLTITVNAINGTIDAGPHTATASIVSGPGSFVGSPSCTYTGGAATASCTVTITSAATGTTVVQATSDIPVDGQVITRTTASNPGPGGSGNASKTWVDANISITPSTANNPVGTNHVLTITVNALGGTIDAGPHTATASIVSGPGSFVGGNTCTYTGGAATASCTVTITSSTAGTTVVSATSDIPVNGQTITRTTGTAANTASGGSDNATKNWGDDTVSTTVRDASNNDITGQTVTGGTVVHDTATVAKTAGTPAGVPNPTGTVDFTLYDNATCNGNVIAGGSQTGVALVGGSAVETATFTTPSAGGDFSYRAAYSGDANYPSAQGPCEVFHVQTPQFAPALTPGFWKNHQAATTALLPITLGNYVVNTFAKALAVFNAMKCSSPIDCLAGHLLAAKLDLASGSNPSILPVIAQADALLIAVNYNGPGQNTANAAQRALALQLEVLIDNYTNQ
jgi:hypothetical protein